MSKYDTDAMLSALQDLMNACNDAEGEASNAENNASCGYSSIPVAIDEPDDAKSMTPTQFKSYMECTIGSMEDAISDLEAARDYAESAIDLMQQAIDEFVQDLDDIEQAAAEDK